MGSVGTYTSRGRPAHGWWREIVPVHLTNQLLERGLVRLLQVRMHGEVVQSLPRGLVRLHLQWMDS